MNITVGGSTERRQ